MKRRGLISIILLVMMLFTTNPMCLAASVSGDDNVNNTQDSLSFTGESTQLQAPVIVSVDGKSSPAYSFNLRPKIKIINIRPNSTLKIFDGSSEIATINVADSNITTYLPTLSIGSHQLTAKTVDAAGNISEPSPEFTYSSILPQPLVPVISSIDGKSSPAYSFNLRPKISITNMQPYTTVKIYDKDTEIAKIDAVDTNITTYLPTLSIGSHQLTAKTVDAAGNISEPSPEFTYSVTTPTQELTSDTTAPTAKISYSITNLTNQNIVASITPSEPVTILNNNGSKSYVFTEIGSFTFNFVDAAGNTGSATATVNNIDKTAPKITIAPYATTPTKENITITATTDEGTLNAESHTFSQNGSFDFIATDDAGNSTTETVTINNIAKTFPKISIASYITTPTKENITVTATTDEGTLNVTAHIFTENGSFDFIATDATGSITTKTVTVNNIDKTAPIITIAPYLTTPTKENISVTATTDEGTLNAESHTFTENGSFDFIATDKAGNITTKTVTISNIVPTTYELELAKWGIKNDGTSPTETSIGLNKALQYAKGQGFTKIVFPAGTYLIDETNPIVIDLKNTVIDLNGSTLQINTNGLEKYSLVQFADGAENVKFVNGTIRGDKDTHDYLTIKTPHEWGCGVVFKGGKNLQMDNVTVTNVTGYGIATESANDSNRFYRLSTKNITQGSISDDGNMVDSTTTTRTITPYDISVCGGQFDLGYTLGYQGYPYLLNREYTSYFYDQDMKFIQKVESFQYRKVNIPAGAKYVHFIFPQVNITGDYAGCYGWLSNFRPPTNVKLTNCLIKENRSLGLAFCGGQQWIIENNIFEGNGGNAPGYAVDFEDGWELMQDILLKNNKFINNNSDLVVCAGNNLVFEGNEFEKDAYIWERTTNYAFIGNKFNGSSVTYKIKKEGCEIRDNQYINSSVNTRLLSSQPITLNNETMINSSIFAAPGTKFINCTIQATNMPYIQNAAMESCTLEVAKAEAINLTLKNCAINKSRINLHTEQYFENCKITDSFFVNYSDTTKIQFTGSEFVNSQVVYSTSSAPTEAIFEQCKATMTTNLPLVRLSAGKTRNLIFRNNTVINQIAKPVIELYDTTYTVPNGNATIEGNNFTMTNYGYVFDGSNISQGIFNFTERDNTITGAQMISPKYIGNQSFNIIK